MIAEALERYEILCEACTALGFTPPKLRDSDEGIPTLWMGPQCVGAFIPAQLGMEFMLAKALSTIGGEPIKAGWFIAGHSCPNENEAAAELRARIVLEK